jgi:hypothetical protein
MPPSVCGPTFLQHRRQRIPSQDRLNVHLLFYTAFFAFVESPFCRPARLC